MSNGDLDGHKCAVAVSYNADMQGLYILGDTFLRNFVSTFDYKRGKVSLAVNINAPIGTAAIYHFGTINIVLVILACIIALLLLGFLARCIRKRYIAKQILKNK